MTYQEKLEAIQTADEDQLIEMALNMSDSEMQAQFGPHAGAIKLYAGAARNAPESSKKGDSLIVLLPGLTGSVLADANRKRGGVIWLNPLAFAQGRLNDLDLGPDGRSPVNPDVKIEASRPLWAAYAKIILRLRAEYDVAVFPFDWRLRIQDSAKQLADFIESALTMSTFDQVTLVGHSMGGLVVFDYLISPQTKARAEELVKRAVTLGTPFKGTLEAVDALANPDDPKMAAARKVNPKNDPHRMLLTFPGMYQLLPAPNNLYVGYEPTPELDIYNPETWNKVEQQINVGYLQEARDFHEKIAAADPQVKLVNIVGANLDTRAQYTAGEILITELAKAVLMQGDTTVDIRSAIFKDSEAYYIQESHIELVLDQSIIKSIMSLADGGSVVDLATDASKAVADEGAFRSGGEPKMQAVDEDLLAQKIANDEALTHAELMAMMSPLRPHQG